MKRYPLIAISILVICIFVGCKPTPPQIVGKWSGHSQLSSQISSTPGSTHMQSAKSVPVQVTLIMSQNGTGVTGDAAVVINAGPPVHLPITGGVIDKDGKLSLEADRSGFSNVHLSFAGKIANGQISGDLALKMDTLVGIAENKGSITFTPTS
ncbi:MAG: hypothetical protein ACRD28_00820 [Acidobacteriaceae bacterium]